MYQISRLNKNDIESLYILLNDIFKSGVKKELLYKLIDNKDIIDIVCKNNDKVIGHAMVEIRYDLFTGEKYYFLNYFCVAEEYRCHGIGNELLMTLEKLAIKNNIDFMRFTSGNKRIEAHKFYKNREYIIRDTSVFIKYFKESLWKII